MRCDEAQRALSEARYPRDAHDATGADARDAHAAREAGVQSPDLRAHLVDCAACSALAAQHAELDRMLSLDEPVAPRPGFDTRFFARLAEERTRPSVRRRRLFWVLMPLAAGTLSMLLVRSSPPSGAAPTVGESTVAGVREVPPDDLALAMDLELVEDLDVVKNLDEVEDYDVLSQLDEDEIERLARESN